MSDSERVLLRRIRDPRRNIRELLDALGRLPNAADQTLDAMDARIINDRQMASSIRVSEYLRVNFRPKLFEALDGQHFFSNGRLVELYSAGYGDQDVEQRIGSWLYEMYEREGNPDRVEVVKALRKRGGINSLRLLEDIRFELEPKYKTDAVVARSIAQLADVNLPQYATFITALALKEFIAEIDLAIRDIKAREVTVESSNRSALPVSDGLQAKAHSNSLHSLGATVHHARHARVIRYRDEARRLLSDHPDAALTKIRKAAEAICKDLLDESSSRAKSTSGKSFKTLEDMQSELRQRKVTVPAHADRYFRAIQGFGNLGSHDQDIDPQAIDERMAQSTLLNLEGLIEWYATYDLNASDSF